MQDVEDTCNAHGDEDSCNADGPCSWCDAAAVRPACHSIDNARMLPSAVFSCSKLDEEEPEEEPVEAEVETPIKDVEDTCFAHKDENSCNADGPCSWCDAAAVKPACHSIDNARNLPPAVFQCSKLTTFDPEDGKFQFASFLDKMRTKHKDEFEPKHHKKQGKHGKQGRPHVKADHDDQDEEKPQIIAGMPFKASVAKKLRKHQAHHERMEDDDEMESPRPRHGHEQGKHHKKHHGCGGCKWFKLFMILLLGAHFMNIRALRHHQEHFAILTGKPIDYDKLKCKWARGHGKKKTAVIAQVQQQPQQIVVSAPVVEYSSGINNSVAEIHEERDKEMGLVFAPAPAPTSIAANQNSMI